MRGLARAARPAVAFGRGLLELLFPARCAACGQRLAEGVPLCALCAESLLPTPPGVPPRAPGLAGVRPRAPYLYGGQLAVALARFKFDRHPELAGPLGLLLAPALAAALAALPPGALLVP